MLYKVVVITDKLPSHREVQKIYKAIQRDLPLEPFSGELLRIEFTDTFNSAYYGIHYPNNLYYARKLQDILRRMLPDPILVEVLSCKGGELR